MRPSQWTTGRASVQCVPANACFSLGRAEPSDGIVGGSGGYIRIQHHGLSAGVRSDTSHETSARDRISLLEREYGNVPASAIPVKEEQPLKPLHPYGISKVCLDLIARQYFMDYGIPAVNVRLFNTTGPGKTDDAPSDFVRRIIRIKKGLQSPILEVGNLTPRRAFLDVHDTVRGFYLAAMKGKRGEVYNLCASDTHQIGDLLRTAIRLSGVKAEIRQAAT